jgi:hypothetical protein
MRRRSWHVPTRTVADRFSGHLPALALATCVLAWSTGHLQAGQCTTEIDNVRKALESRDAGAGPISGTAGIAPMQDPDAPVGRTGSMDGGAALARARDMDQLGKEEECMDAIREAKKLSGVR